MTCLDLNDAGFAKVDVRKFQNLEVLLLKGNALTSLDDTGINTLSQSLKVLDLRDNKLGKMEEIVALIRMLPKLTTLGISGNKCTDSKNW
jgi:Leucine-rich repeat (LRR) protein